MDYTLYVMSLHGTALGNYDVAQQHLLFNLLQQTASCSAAVNRILKRKGTK